MELGLEIGDGEVFSAGAGARPSNLLEERTLMCWRMAAASTGGQRRQGRAGGGSLLCRGCGGCAGRRRRGVVLRGRRRPAERMTPKMAAPAQTLCMSVILCKSGVILRRGAVPEG